MEQCMRSFQLSIFQSITCTSGNSGTEIKTWGTVGQYFWSLSVKPNNASSIYNLTGFKNVNIYGVNVNGFVRGDPSSATKCAVVQDWMIFLNLDGNSGLISGDKSISPDGFSLYTLDPVLNYYQLSKYTSSVSLATPITSVKTITFESVFAQGIGAEFLNSIDLNYRLNFTFYYKYEGENE